MSKKKIIVIDDVELNRVILAEAFKNDYEILQAENGAVGLKKIRDNIDDIAAIFLDIIMPEMDGFAVLQELNINSLIQRLPVFLITTDATSGVIERAYDYGAVDVIPKPFNTMIIKRRVQNMIEFFEAKRQSDSSIMEIDHVLKMQREDLNNAVGSLIGRICEVIESRSPEDSEHVNRVRQITKDLAAQFASDHPEFGLKEEIIDAISNASVLHDLGKIYVRDEILTKPQKLTTQEMEIVKSAPSLGAKLLGKVQGIPEPFFTFAKEICRSHMERFDGKGYPDGLKGNQIPISAQLAGIAEAYDVLVSSRVYKKAYSHSEALKMIQNDECGAFNHEVLSCLQKIAGKLVQDVYNAK
ncbi:MAG: HD domain-containing phosphohydrolase [Treponema sp.]|nr:HD domain-containing phosphohydrolase [Treponema sp.]MEE3436000.1 HD domain-containing phosphohydrolase [Treponema sp.]